MIYIVGLALSFTVGPAAHFATRAPSMVTMIEPHTDAFKFGSGNAYSFAPLGGSGYGGEVKPVSISGTSNGEVSNEFRFGTGQVQPVPMGGTSVPMSGDKTAAPMGATQPMDAPESRIAPPTSATSTM